MPAHPKIIIKQGRYQETGWQNTVPKKNPAKQKQIEGVTVE